MGHFYILMFSFYFIHRAWYNTTEVDINQDEPQSNAIHIAHNVPTGSDISVVQTRPYNTTVHISLNIASDCKVNIFGIY